MDNANRRVVVTGMGLVSPLGMGRTELWNALTQGRSGVRTPQTLPEGSIPVSYCAEAVDFTGAIEDFAVEEKTLQRTIKKNLKVMCREIEMGVAASQRALLDCALNLGSIDPGRIGVSFGSDYIMTLPQEFAAGISRCLDENGKFQFPKWPESGLPKVDPLWLLKYLPNMPASHVAIFNNLLGPNNSITLREASSNLAVGEAHTTIARGAADVMVVGATGSRVHPLRTLHMFLQEDMADPQAEPAKASRPFDKGRTGCVLGEGAGAIVMEDYDHAVKRGAPILAEVVGWGSSTVVQRGMHADLAKALSNSMKIALKKANRGPESVGHVHAHGLSTQVSDREEAKAINTIFGDATSEKPVVAAKSFFGNLGAGSGMIELIASLIALEKGELFPTLNYDTPDPECAIRVVTSPEPAGDSFLNLNVTPQGQASAVAIAKLAA